jgi:hypothetical protein
MTTPTPATVPGGNGRSTSPRPRPVTPADQEAFDTLVKQALPTVRAMAAAWRTGLTGLITLVTTGIVLTGRTSTADLTPPWRAAVTATIGTGLALAILGLWHALAAEVGAKTRLQSLEQIRSDNASVQAYLVGQAAAAGHRLNVARHLVATALTLLLTGVGLTWWAPPAPTDPPAYLKVTRPDSTICGTLTSADSGTLHVRVTGVHDPVPTPLTTITNLTITSACP